MMRTSRITVLAGCLMACAAMGIAHAQKSSQARIDAFAKLPDLVKRVRALERKLGLRAPKP